MVSFLHEACYRPQTVCGIDEAGRGPLAGPVIAAAVIFADPAPLLPSGLNDSKQVARTQREALYAWIYENASVGIGEASVAEIDTLNILQATMLAMRRAAQALPHTPQVALIDGNRAPGLSCETVLLVGGDAISASIAAASIIAKVTRDRMMEAFDAEYPQYGFARHAGYGTAAHRAALQEYGPCPIHRRSFAPVRALLPEAA
jgi:ribonuclease HII